MKVVLNILTLTSVLVAMSSSALALENSGTGSCALPSSKKDKPATSSATGGSQDSGSKDAAGATSK